MILKIQMKNSILILMKNLTKKAIKQSVKTEILKVRKICYNPIEIIKQIIHCYLPNKSKKIQSPLHLIM